MNTIDEAVHYLTVDLNLLFVAADRRPLITQGPPVISFRRSPFTQQPPLNLQTIEFNRHSVGCAYFVNKISNRGLCLHTNQRAISWRS